MKSFVALTLAGLAMAIPQANSPPAGCQASTSGTFQITTVNVTGSSSSKRSLESRQLAGALTLSLQNGILKDQAGRIGYIASNYQFQFDNPVQAGAREQSGFSLCSNGSLALSNGRPSGAAVWFSCLSGSFYNLYSQSQGGQCIPIYIVRANGGGASQAPDGQPQATQSPRVTQISDGQPQASSPRPVISQISDGQPQASSPRPAPVVTQISDGQPQAPRPTSRAPVVSQISDGQPQAPRPTSRAPVVSQISDGQPQAPRPTSMAPVVSQISDGQPQAPRPTSRAPVVSQISDGQPQAPQPTIRPNATTSAPAIFTGAAATGQAAVGAFAAGLFGLFALL